MSPILRQIVLPIAAILVAIIPANAANFTNLHNFSGSDGANSEGGLLLLSGNTLYGTAAHGGVGGSGTIFKINTGGSGFTNFFSFGGSNGAVAQGGLILSANSLYGTTAIGGSSDNGTVYKINIDGTGFTNIYNFPATTLNGSVYTNRDGANPYAGLVLFGSALYGTTYSGGSGGDGTVFKVNTNGTGFTNLYSFTATAYNGSSYTNGDGASPYAGLVLSGNALYGTTYSGGNFGNGTVFKINADGTGFTNLHHFTTVSYNGSTYTNGDGASPQSGLALSGLALFGTTINGGRGGNGAVFRVNTDGSGFTNIYSFTSFTNGSFPFINTDGANPFSALGLSGNTLYGTAYYGGTAGAGTIFRVHTNGAGFANLYNFSNSVGINVNGTLIINSNILFGATINGGTNNAGAVFALTLPVPVLGIQLVGNLAILSWDDSGFNLQAAPAVTGVYTNVPGAVSPYTNVVNSSEKFFRALAN